VRRRIDTLTDKGFRILVGDANGADKAVQKYLAENKYRDVAVYCMADNCRNNTGDWPMRELVAPKGVRGFAYYTMKDQAMVDDTTYGLMLWDGESKGTLNNVINMVRQKKPVVVYLAPRKVFQTLRSADDLMTLLTNCDRASVERFERELGIEQVLHRAPIM
jgi:hypothetical protein